MSDGGLSVFCSVRQGPGCLLGSAATGGTSYTQVRGPRSTFSRYPHSKGICRCVSVFNSQQDWGRIKAAGLFHCFSARGLLHLTGKPASADPLPWGGATWQDSNPAAGMGTTPQGRTVPYCAVETRSPWKRDGLESQGVYPDSAENSGCQPCPGLSLSLALWVEGVLCMPQRTILARECLQMMEAYRDLLVRGPCSCPMMGLIY